MRCRITNSWDCVIKGRGFVYRPSPDSRSLAKIPQTSTIKIGNRVEIGEGGCIDRGKFSGTSIGDDAKIDNLIQIAHNSKLDRSCVIFGRSGLAGSVTLGNGIMIRGGARVKNHVTIGDGVKLGGNACIISDVASGKTFFGFTTIDQSTM